MEDKKITMPAVALRGLTILPGMVQHFDISREKSIRAIETAMMGNQKVYLVTQRHPEQETPAVADLYQMGTISQIKQLVKMPGGIIRVMVEGDKRAALLTLFEEGPYLEAEVEEAPMQEEQLTDTVKEAMSRIVKEKLEEFGNANPKAVKDFIGSLLVITDLEQLLTQTANEFPWDFAVKQEMLECDYWSHLYDRIVYYLMRELEILMIKRDYQGKVKEHIDKNQRDYILREELKVIREELGDDSRDGRCRWIYGTAGKAERGQGNKGKDQKRDPAFQGHAGRKSGGECPPHLYRDGARDAVEEESQGTIRISFMRKRSWRRIIMVWRRLRTVYWNSLRSAPSQRKAQARSSALWDRREQVRPPLRDPWPAPSERSMYGSALAAFTTRRRSAATERHTWERCRAVSPMQCARQAWQTR